MSFSALSLAVLHPSEGVVKKLLHFFRRTFDGLLEGCRQMRHGDGLHVGWTGLKDAFLVVTVTFCAVLIVQMNLYACELISEAIESRRHYAFNAKCELSTPLGVMACINLYHHVALSLR